MRENTCWYISNWMKLFLQLLWWKKGFGIDIVVIVVVVEERVDGGDVLLLLLLKKGLMVVSGDVGPWWAGLISIVWIVWTQARKKTQLISVAVLMGIQLKAETGLLAASGRLGARILRPGREACSLHDTKQNLGKGGEKAPFHGLEVAVRGMGREPTQRKVKMVWQLSTIFKTVGILLLEQWGWKLVKTHYILVPIVVPYVTTTKFWFLGSHLINHYQSSPGQLMQQSSYFGA